MRLAIHRENGQTFPVMLKTRSARETQPIFMADIRSLFSVNPPENIFSLRTLLPKLCDSKWCAECEANFDQFPQVNHTNFCPTSPVCDSVKILCVGLNYRDHAQECHQSIPSQPVWFNKLPTSLCGPNDTIEVPSVVEFADYEAELVVVIGRGGRNIPLDEAFSHIAGYTCGNDVTARDWQFGRPGGQWFAGKTFDTFAPLGPVLVTPNELMNPMQLSIECRVNGIQCQHSQTSQFIFPIDFLIHEISQVCTLEPGDLIYTGTPPGIGHARKPPVPLATGDVVEVEIEGIGVLRNLVNCAK